MERSEYDLSSAFRLIVPRFLFSIFYLFCFLVFLNKYFPGQA